MREFTLLRVSLLQEFTVFEKCKFIWFFNFVSNFKFVWLNLAADRWWLINLVLLVPDPTGPPQVPPPSTSASSLISPTAQQQQTEAAAQLLVTLSGLEPQQQQQQQGLPGKPSVQVAASSSANIAQTGSLPPQPTTRHGHSHIFLFTLFCPY